MARISVSEFMKKGFPVSIFGRIAGMIGNVQASLNDPKTDLEATLRQSQDEDLEKIVQKQESKTENAEDLVKLEKENAVDALVENYGTENFDIKARSAELKGRK